MCCSKCGNQISEDSLFCSACGASVDASVAPNGAKENHQAEPFSQEFQEASDYETTGFSQQTGIAENRILTPQQQKRNKMLVVIAGIATGIIALSAAIEGIAGASSSVSYLFRYGIANGLAGLSSAMVSLSNLSTAIFFGLLCVPIFKRSKQGAITAVASFFGANVVYSSLHACWVASLSDHDILFVLIDICLSCIPGILFCVLAFTHGRKKPTLFLIPFGTSLLFSLPFMSMVGATYLYLRIPMYCFSMAIPILFSLAFLGKIERTKKSIALIGLFCLIPSVLRTLFSFLDSPRLLEGASVIDFIHPGSFFSNIFKSFISGILPYLLLVICLDIPLKKPIRIKKTLLYSLLIGVVLVLVGMLVSNSVGKTGSVGGSSSLPSNFTGTYTGSPYTFGIGALTFYDDGTVDITMDQEYTGTYKKSGDKYAIKITGGKNSISDLLAKEKNRECKITFTLNDDGTITVFLKAKSGYFYYGEPSAVFKKE